RRSIVTPSSSTGSRDSPTQRLPPPLASPSERCARVSVERACDSANYSRRPDNRYLTGPKPRKVEMDELQSLKAVYPEPSPPAGPVVQRHRETLMMMIEEATDVGP